MPKRPARRIKKTPAKNRPTKRHERICLRPKARNSIAAFRMAARCARNMAIFGRQSGEAWHHRSMADVTPRLAATTILVRARGTEPELLLLKRGENARFMPNAYVFAGGALDLCDEGAE